MKRFSFVFIYLRKQNDGVEELLERYSSVSVPVYDVEHLHDENVLLVHAQRRRKLLLRQRRSHHHDHVTRHIFELENRKLDIEHLSCIFYI
jgi:spore cortex formation protein SpoVR/YcgB (stage V sporulation)